MKRRIRAFWVLAVALLAGCASPGKAPVSAQAPQPVPAAVQVYAAGSLREPLTEIARDYQARTGVPVALTFGASALLRERIEEGGAAQVFASADMAQPRQLAAAGGWQEPVEFARDAVCALTNDQVHAAPATLLGTMLRPEVRLGTFTPGADPAGDDAWALFRKADAIQPGAYAALDAKARRFEGRAAGSTQLAPGQSVAARVMLQRQADVFLTDCSRAAAAQKEVPGLHVVQFPPVLQVSALYGLSVRNNATRSAFQFEQALLATPAQAVLRRYGFVAPGGAGAAQR